MTIVIKIGGAALEDASTLRKCAKAIAELAQDGHRVAVVHGGGSALTRVLKQLGKQSEFIGGLRVTDAETRDVALMVLGGMVNKKLVAAMACRSGLGESRFAATIWDSLARFASPSLVGSKPFGNRVEFRFSHPSRSGPMANTTTSMQMRWPRPAPQHATPMLSSF